MSVLRKNDKDNSDLVNTRKLLYHSKYQQVVNNLEIVDPSWSRNCSGIVPLQIPVCSGYFFFKFYFYTASLVDASFRFSKLPAYINTAF